MKKQEIDLFLWKYMGSDKYRKTRIDMYDILTKGSIHQIIATKHPEKDIKTNIFNVFSEHEAF